MKKYFILVICLGVFLSASAVLGSEIIRFKGGTCLVAQSHRLDGKMVYVTLGGGNEVGFPISIVEKIEDRSGQTLYNTFLFNTKSSNTTGNAKNLSNESSRFPPGFSAELDSLAKYRTNKTKKAKEGYTPSVMFGTQYMDARRKVRSATAATQIGSSRGTTTQNYQGKKYSITVKTARTRASGKQDGGNELQPVTPE